MHSTHTPLIIICILFFHCFPYLAVMDDSTYKNHSYNNHGTLHPQHTNSFAKHKLHKQTKIKHSQSELTCIRHHRHLANIKSPIHRSTQFVRKSVRTVKQLLYRSTLKSHMRPHNQVHTKSHFTLIHSINRFWSGRILIWRRFFDQSIQAIYIQLQNKAKIIIKSNVNANQISHTYLQTEKSPFGTKQI